MITEEQYRASKAPYLMQLSKAVTGSATMKVVGGGYFPEIRQNNGHIYNPEHNAEQRWELLEWYVKRQVEEDGNMPDASSLLTNWLEALTADDIMLNDNPPLALILAALELIDD